MKTLLILGAALTIGLLPSVALATPQDEANDVAQEVMSPFCPGVTLHECPSAKAIELRDEIAGWFAQGLTHEQVLDRLENEYGPGIRATPQPRGTGLAAWLLPVAGLAIGFGVLALVLRRRSDSDPQTTVAGPDRERLEAELSIARLKR